MATRPGGHRRGLRRVAAPPDCARTRRPFCRTGASSRTRARDRRRQGRDLGRARRSRPRASGGGLRLRAFAAGLRPGSRRIRRRAPRARHERLPGVVAIRREARRFAGRRRRGGPSRGHRVDRGAAPLRTPGHARRRAARERAAARGAEAFRRAALGDGPHPRRDLRRGIPHLGPHPRTDRSFRGGPDSRPRRRLSRRRRALSRHVPGSRLGHGRRRGRARRAGLRPDARRRANAPGDLGGARRSRARPGRVGALPAAALEPWGVRSGARTLSVSVGTAGGGVRRPGRPRIRGAKRNATGLAGCGRRCRGRALLRARIRALPAGGGLPDA